MVDQRNNPVGFQARDMNIDERMNEAASFDVSKQEKAVSFLELQEEGEDQQQEESLDSPCQQPSSQPQQTEVTTPIDDEEEELRDLRRRLVVLQKRRRKIQHSANTTCANHQEILLGRLNARRKERNQIVEEYVSAWKGRDSVCLFLDCSKKWNVLNDCFSIWIDGNDAAFPTINGCRLGAETAPLPTELLSAASQDAKQQKKGKWVSNNGTQATINGNAGAMNSPPRRRILGFFGSSSDDGNNNNVSAQRRVAPIPALVVHTHVPWLEVNAALGHACLLLKILQETSSKKGGTGLKFTHELHPMGSTSKIGIRFGTPDSGVIAAATGFGSILSSGAINTPPPVLYNLFFEETSGFSFFKNNGRNFNWALQAFLQCIAEAAAQQTDKTIAIPHSIRHQKGADGAFDNTANNLNGGEWIIGGLSICYPAATNPAQNQVTTHNKTTTSALEWTRACRYLLTDLKWLVAYSARHVNR